MAKFDIYTAVAMQPEIIAVSKREDIRKNLKRNLELIDAAPQCRAERQGALRGELGTYQADLVSGILSHRS